MSQVVTFIVHGTYAAGAPWWRPGTAANPTFADRLETELSKRGMAGTVWGGRAATEDELEAASFAWSGENRHRDRVRAGSQIAAKVNEFATRSAATHSDPLTVNFVAHSHGGNVVLEALPRLSASVRVGRVVLLGTPLITSRPAFRIARFIFATILLAFLFLSLFVAAIVLVAPTLLKGKEFGDTPWVIGPLFILLAFATLLGYGWLFVLSGNFLDVIWRVVARTVEPISWMRGRDSRIVYGPSPRRLAAILRDRPILSLTGRNDEADLLLQITLAPSTLYQEYVKSRFSHLTRALEFVFVRPFALAAFLNAVEMILEMISLGFPAWRALFLDFAVAPIGQHPYDAAGLLVRKRVDVPAVNDVTRARSPANADPSVTDEVQPTGKRGVHVSLQEVAAEVRRQIRLRHSAYYENPAVIDAVADFVAGAAAESSVTTETPVPAVSGGFWERLAVANVLLAVMFALLAGEGGVVVEGGSRLFMPIAFAFLGYVGTFAASGAVIVIQRIRRKKRRSPERILWSLWGVFALLMLIAAAGNRMEPRERALASPAVKQMGDTTTP